MSAGPPLTLRVEGRIAIVTFDAPGQSVNTLGRRTLTALEAAVGELEGLAAAGLIDAALLRSAKTDNFIAGADLSEFGQIRTLTQAEEAIRAGQSLFSRVEALPIPTAAVVEGTCVGGGLELVLACTFRVGSRSERTKIGLPEVQLGIVPAWGGTQRLPRAVGLMRGVQMITAGQLIDPVRARRWGILDALTPAGQPATIAALALCERARTTRRARRRRPPEGLVARLMGSVGRSLLFSKAREAVLERTDGHYPAPLAAIDCIEAGAYAGQDEGFAKELAAGRKLIISETSRNLVSIFFLTERIKKDRGVAPDVPAREVRRVGVLGAGVMGGGIAQIVAYNRTPVRIRDISLGAIDTAMAEIGRLFVGAEKRRKLDRRQRTNRQALVSHSLSLQGFGSCDFVIEAVVESLAVKRAVLAEVEGRVAHDTILATNTSSLSVDAMAEALERPEQLVGMHFFNPVHKMPLVEVVRGAATSDEVVATTVAFAKRLGKRPVVTRDAPGFLVNRVLMPLMNEAALLVEEGFDLAAVDEALLDFGLPMGAFLLLDTVGLDVAAKVADVFVAAFGDRIPSTDLLHRMVEAGRLGRKSGGGFYCGGRRSQGVDPRVYRILPGRAQRRETPDPATVVDRVILRMLVEAVLLLEEGVVRSAADVDAGMIFGAGFPPFHGGLMAYADRRGLPAVVSRLESLRDRHGPRFTPPPSLRLAAADGQRLRQDQADAVAVGTPRD